MFKLAQAHMHMHQQTAFLSPLTMQHAQQYNYKKKIWQNLFSLRSSLRVLLVKASPSIAESPLKTQAESYQ